MPAHPRPGDAYRQAYFQRGKALDEVRVLSLSGRLTVPFGTFLLVTSGGSSPLQPQTNRRIDDRRREDDVAGGDGLAVDVTVVWVVSRTSAGGRHGHIGREPKVAKRHWVPQGVGAASDAEKIAPPE
jgi:hypothetical protein